MTANFVDFLELSGEAFEIIFLMSLSQDQKMSLSFFHVIKMKRWNAWGSFWFFSNRNNQRANIDVDSGYCLLTVWSLCLWYKVANLIAWKLMGEWLVIGLAIGHSVRRHKEHHTFCFFLFEFNIFFPKLKWVNVNDIHQWKFSVRDGWIVPGPKLLHFHFSLSPTQTFVG